MISESEGEESKTSLGEVHPEMLLGSEPHDASLDGGCVTYCLPPRSDCAQQKPALSSCQEGNCHPGPERQGQELWG